MADSTHIASTTKTTDPPLSGEFKAPSLPVGRPAKRRSYGLILPERPPEQAPTDAQQSNTDNSAKTETSEPAPPPPPPPPSGPITFETPDGPVKLNYEPPFWSAPPCFNFYFEEIKDGSVVKEHGIHTKGFYLIGRAPYCDIEMEHPVRPKFWYLYC